VERRVNAEKARLSEEHVRELQAKDEEREREVRELQAKDEEREREVREKDEEIRELRARLTAGTSSNSGSPYRTLHCQIRLAN
jgi:predicted  nucleic acid-binding Zn-ribbon protein